MFNGGVVEYVQTTAGGLHRSVRRVSHVQRRVWRPAQSVLWPVSPPCSCSTPRSTRSSRIRATCVLGRSSPTSPLRASRPTTQSSRCNRRLGRTRPRPLPMPIIRNEEMVLIDAAIQLGLGNNANAIALINAVRSAAHAAPVAPGTFAAIQKQSSTSSGRRTPREWRVPHDHDPELRAAGGIHDDVG